MPRNASLLFGCNRSQARVAAASAWDGSKTSAAFKTLALFVAILGASALSFGAALAQSRPPAAVISNGDAVVTGFSGAQPPAAITQGVDPADQISIDLTGAAARVIDLQVPGAPPRAQVLTVPKPFTVLAGQVGGGPIWHLLSAWRNSAGQRFLLSSRPERN